MKFIGQYIQDFIARFRSDVYLEDVSSGTIASGGNLGLDSNNKIVKADVPADGDITTITIGDTTTTSPILSGDATVQFLAGEGVDVALNSVSANVKQITYSGEDASTSNKGVASFSSDNFAASSGAITIKDGGVDLTAEVTGVLPSANLDADTAHLSTTQTFTGAKTFDETISGSIDGNAATVTTNANLTGHVTSSGNAAVLGSFTVSQLNTAISNATISGDNTGDQTTVSGSSGSCTGNAATATNLTASTSTAVGLGTIELGHATDTTIARSAAGKVTIESAPIQTTQMSVTNHAFALDANNSLYHYFPLNNLNESRLGDTAQYYVRLIAPYAGRVLRVVVRATADMGDCRIRLTKLSTSGQDPDGLRDEGTDVETTDAVDCSAINTTQTFNLTAAFAAGDVVNVGLLKGSTNTAFVTAAVVWEYTV
jgi:hypothetical protein